MKKARKKPDLEEAMASEATGILHASPLLMPLTPSVSSSKTEEGLQQALPRKLIWIEAVPEINTRKESEIDWVREVLERHFELAIFQVSDWYSSANAFAAWYTEQKYTEQKYTAQKYTEKKYSEQNTAIPTPLARKSILGNDLLIASAYRTDSIDCFSQSIQSLAPNLKQRIVLGQWWAGHRRTAPFSFEKSPGEISTYYWYQIYDQLLTDLCLDDLQPSEFAPAELPSLNTTEVPASRASAPNLSLIESALIYSNNPDLRKLMLDSFALNGIHTVGMFDLNNPPEADFKYIVIDGDLGVNSKENRGLTESQESGIGPTIRSIRRRYPSSIVAVLFGFPEWRETQRALEAGADLIFGKPCRWIAMISRLKTAYSKRSI